MTVDRAAREAHDRAVAAGEPGYLDPASGAFVFTAVELAARGECCGSGCRHCPYPLPDAAAASSRTGSDRNGEDDGSLLNRHRTRGTDTMPGQAPFHTDEHDLLLGYLAQQREVLRLTAYGLTDEQARTPAAAPSPLTVGGLVKHVARTEQGWIDIVAQRARSGYQDEDDYVEGFTMGADETLDDLFRFSDAVAAETEAVVRGVADLGRAVPVPRGVPWYPDDLDAWTVRWVMLHMVAETARHAGHADIVREAIDGATAFPLMAAAEGWPATPWLQPWAPGAARAAGDSVGS